MGFAGGGGEAIRGIQELIQGQTTNEFDFRIAPFLSLLPMSRVARIVVPGFPHHVTQRGNRRDDVFYTDDDCRAYLRFLRQYAERHGLSILAYCLMTNHIHLVAVPQREDSLAKALRDAHTVYAMRFNTTTQQSGGTCGRGAFTLVRWTKRTCGRRYATSNVTLFVPAVSHAADYPWSSAPAHCRNGADGVLSKEFPRPGL